MMANPERVDMSQNDIERLLSRVRGKVKPSEFDEIKKFVGLLKDCCDKKEMDKVAEHSKELSAFLDNFVKKYI